jgi:hypothetical protein
VNPRTASAIPFWIFAGLPLLALMGTPPAASPPPRQQVVLDPEYEQKLVFDICENLLDAGKLREGAHCRKPGRP